METEYSRSVKCKVSKLQVERIVINTPKPLPQPFNNSYIPDGYRNVTSVGKFVRANFCCCDMTIIQTFRWGIRLLKTDAVLYMAFLIIKPSRFTKFSNLFLE